MKEPTEQEKAVIRNRQMLCTHSFIKSQADPTRRCVHCGVSQADWEQMQATFGFVIP